MTNGAHGSVLETQTNRLIALDLRTVAALREHRGTKPKSDWPLVVFGSIAVQHQLRTGAL